MTLALLFNLANIYILPFWTIMILLPNWNITKKIVKSYLIFIPLIGLYIYYLVTTFNYESTSTLANLQLADVAAFFSQEGAAGAAWIHFLVIDLFVGRWIYWQGQEKSIWTIHSLVLCLFFCPVGLLSHIITSFLFSKTNLEETTIDSSVSS